MYDYVHGTNPTNKKYWGGKKYSGDIPEIKPYELIIPRGLSFLSALNGLIRTRKQPTSHISSYYPNTGADAALNVLKNLKINNRPMLKGVNDMEYSTLLGISNDRNLSASQKHLLKLNTIYNAQKQRN
jgi:hypothetical protein